MASTMKDVDSPKTIHFLLSNLCSHIQQSERRCQVSKPPNNKAVFVQVQSKFLRTTLQPSYLKPMLPTLASPVPHPILTPFALFSCQNTQQSLHSSPSIAVLCILPLGISQHLLLLKLGLALKASCITVLLSHLFLTQKQSPKSFWLCFTTRKLEEI